ncbi:ArdC-like ssDNA-binding domain-containing protein [Nitrosomonas mobilis]|uniref:N-terminal domain-containing protein n=1 Tax=Nitrosomonas mobilis TaxID=51642 RepID=A0A1G5SDE7_9PROT|nr:ArdC-like ssDNA-binding domain-containing protein [Nitrosomonas mobilis]SCZ85007.1 conserved hypothetical protein [Nitrosomonas mobilis]
MEKVDWNLLLHDALSMPGKLSEAYFAMHNYSLSNRVLAIKQLVPRGLPISPIASFNRWKELGRKVKKGEKALSLIMPLTIWKRNEASDENDETDKIHKGFMLKKFWFSLYQTDGDPVPEIIIPEWDREMALSRLGIREEVFVGFDGNSMGYAVPRESLIAINPLNRLPFKTSFHEIAHCLLHSEESILVDYLLLEKAIYEVEAESVAYLCCASLGLPGLEESRGFIQYWMSNSAPGSLSDKNIRRIFGAADRILSAGHRG